jgi:hypothetical protein
VKPQHTEQWQREEQEQGGDQPHRETKILHRLREREGEGGERDQRERERERERERGGGVVLVDGGSGVGERRRGRRWVESCRRGEGHHRRWERTPEQWSQREAEREREREGPLSSQWAWHHSHLLY